MENTVHPEPELEKHEESMPEGTPQQSSEPATEEKKEGSNDPSKKMQDELAEAKDKYVRLYAEFDNFRKRNAKEKLDLISFERLKKIKQANNISTQALNRFIIQSNDDYDRFKYEINNYLMIDESNGKLKPSEKFINYLHNKSVYFSYKNPRNQITLKRISELVSRKIRYKFSREKNV